MKKLPFFFIFTFAIIAIGCSSEDENLWEDYAEWRDANDTWVNEQKERLNENGEKYYTTLVPSWDPSQFILIHYFNDRMLTANNPSPYYTSTVDVKYIGWLYNDESFDSSYGNTASYGDSLYRTKCNNVIQGWTVALEDMHIGDSCEVIIPYTMAYGAQTSGSILPYSALRFHIKLVDIPYYEVKEN